MPRLSSPVEIGAFRYYPSRNTIASRDRTVRLTPKASAVLDLLIRHRGECVPRETLLNSVWNNELASDELLTRAIADLRRSFEDSFRSPHYIETVPKKGYLLVAPVQRLQPEDSVSDQPATGRDIVDQRLPLRNIARWSMAALAVLLLAAISLMQIGGTPEPASPRFPDTYQVDPLHSGGDFDEHPAIAPGGDYHTWSRAGQLMIRARHGSYDVQLTPDDGASYLSSAISSGGDHILVSRVSGDRCGIYRLPVFGSVMTDHLAECDPRFPQVDWSDDGLRFVFTEPGGPGSAIVVSGMNGHEVWRSQPPADAVDHSPRLSPDGLHLAWVRNGAAGPLLMVGTLAGEEPVREFPAADCCFGIDWLGNSHTLLVSRGHAGRPHLWTLDTQTGSWKLVEGTAGASAPAVDPVSGAVAFSRTLQDRSIWIRSMESPSGDFKPLVDSPRSDHSASASPDGTRLAFISDRSGEDQVWVRKLSSGEERMVSEFSGVSLERPDWSPDGSRLIVGTVGSGDRTVYVLDPGTGGATALLLSAERSTAGGHWRGNGSSVLYFCADQPGQWNLCETPLNAPGETRVVARDLGEPKHCLYFNADGGAQEWMLYTNAGDPGTVQALNLNDPQNVTVVQRGSLGIRPLSFNGSRVVLALEDSGNSSLFFSSPPWQMDPVSPVSPDLSGPSIPGTQIEVARNTVYLTRTRISGARVELMRPES